MDKTLETVKYYFSHLLDFKSQDGYISYRRQNMMTIIITAIAFLTLIFNLIDNHPGRPVGTLQLFI
ncbi:hypothetical protein ERX37_01200 [Macrococcus hajekii]|uniref:Uncharacterized protein n=1 Tax=Macrococcus hajekii TaxID=198482 RepID=A0A4R6BLS1_9STAP|nr:hypothetical protein [Macrococcus hajekii]TDM02736.1 hypothetical protein ERX37_01200 [Macrococcus hajekii]